MMAMATHPILSQTLISTSGNLGRTRFYAGSTFQAQHFFLFGHASATGHFTIQIPPTEIILLTLVKKGTMFS